MKPLITLFLVLGCLTAHAGAFDGYLGKSDGTIIQVTRKLRMSSQEPLSPKEFYVNVGTRDGAREGDIYEVFRMVPVTDALGTGEWHLMKVTLGELKVHVAGETASVARIARMKKPDELPPMDYTAFMVGDQVRKKTSLPFRSTAP